MDCAPILREHPLFRNLSAEQMRLVADLAEEHTVPAGAVLSQQADLGATLFIIGEGEAVVHHIDGQGLRRPVGMISAGMIYGVTSLFLQDPRDATVTAASPVRLWTIRREPFQRLLAERPALARRLDVPSEVVRRMRAPVFPWLEPGESVALFTRRHPLSFWRQAAVIAIVAGLCLATLTLTSRLTGWPRNLATWGPLTAAAFALALLWQWLDWRNDYLIVTTRRVAHRERVSLLYESRYEAPLERVQNINIRRGLLGSLFGYGQISVETAAKVGGLTFSETPAPSRRVRRCLHSWHACGPPSAPPSAGTSRRNCWPALGRRGRPRRRRRPIPTNPWRSTQSRRRRSTSRAACCAPSSGSPVRASSPPRACPSTGPLSGGNTGSFYCAGRSAPPSLPCSLPGWRWPAFPEGPSSWPPCGAPTLGPWWPWPSWEWPGSGGNTPIGATTCTCSATTASSTSRSARSFFPRSGVRRRWASSRTSPLRCLASSPPC
ncbi:MAG: cyclic nucleotide-binding domain-containing protein [Chloroflexi bacterium]|nr:cyclic nucleotide-binding domain-containing protein [Chloroflexota bacterium]